MRKTTTPSKTKLPRLLVIFFLLFGLSSAFSQTIYYDTISKKKYAKVDVHATYERVIQKGYESIEMLEYLGIYYYKDRDFQKSKLYFDRLFKKYKIVQISTKSIDLYNKLINERI